MKHVLFLLIILFSTTVNALCPTGDAAARKNGFEAALSLYTECALGRNDDDTQLILARHFKKQNNIIQTLFYYHLAADNGNANAQVELADLLLKLDETSDTRQHILDYYDTLEKMRGNYTISGFTPLKISPYALLILANEPAEKKWYYPSTTHVDPNASTKLFKYAKTLTDAKKQKAQQEVTAFKTKKMLEAALSILSPAEYATFQQTVFPQTGIADTFSAKQQLDYLKEKIESFPQK